MNRVATGEGTRRVRPDTLERDPTRSVPWHPASTTEQVGSPRMAASPATRSGRCSHSSRSPLSSRPISSRRRSTTSRRPRACASSWRGRASRPGRPSCPMRPRPRRCRPRLSAPRWRWAARYRGARPGPGGASRPRSVRATTLSPTRSTVSQEHASSALCTTSASSASCRLSEGSAIRSTVAASRSVTAPSGTGAVVAQHLVELGLVVPLALGQALDHEHTRHEELAPRVLAATAGRMATHQGGTTPRRDLLARLGVDDGDGRVEDAPARRAPRPCRSARRR